MAWCVGKYRVFLVVWRNAGSSGNVTQLLVYNGLVIGWMLFRLVLIQIISLLIQIRLCGYWIGMFLLMCMVGGALMSPCNITAQPQVQSHGCIVCASFEVPCARLRFVRGPSGDVYLCQETAGYAGQNQCSGLAGQCMVFVAVHHALLVIPMLLADLVQAQ